MVLNFDNLFCIPPCKDLLLVAMEMIQMMLNKQLVNRLPVSPTWNIFKNILKENNYELYISATQKLLSIHSSIMAENVSFQQVSLFFLFLRERLHNSFKVRELISGCGAHIQTWVYCFWSRISVFYCILLAGYDS